MRRTIYTQSRMVVLSHLEMRICKQNRRHRPTRAWYGTRKWSGIVQTQLRKSHEGREPLEGFAGFPEIRILSTAKTIATLSAIPQTLCEPRLPTGNYAADAS